MRARALLALMMCGLMLAACIPPSPDYASSDAEPRLASEPMDTMFDENPVWEDRPVTPGSDASGRYVVQPGDTGIAIARAHGVPWARIVEANGLVEPFIIKVGQALIIPGAGGNEAQSALARAAAFKLEIDDIVTGGEPASLGAAQVLDDPSEAISAPLPSNVAVREPARFSGVFGWPVQGTIKQRFGLQGEGQFNDGIELGVSQGAAVKAAGEGVVAFVGDGVTGYDGVILIRHGNGWISAYGRTARAAVTRGQTVKRGQVIGYAGNGAAPQIHFELRKDRKPVDPLKQLPPL